MMKIKGHTLFLRNKKNQSLESQTFLKIPFLATPRIVFAQVSGTFEHPNSQCRAGARRSQEIPPGSPHSCVGLGGLVVGTKSKILILILFQRNQGTDILTVISHCMHDSRSVLAFKSNNFACQCWTDPDTGGNNSLYAGCHLDFSAQLTCQQKNPQ